MANPNGRKGAKYEQDVADYLNEYLPGCVERRVKNGRKDRGDIAGIPGWVLECKNTKVIDLPGALKEAEREAENAGVTHFAAVVNRKQKHISDSYFVVPLALAIEWLSENPTKEQ